MMFVIYLVTILLFMVDTYCWLIIIKFQSELAVNNNGQIVSRKGHNPRLHWLSPRNLQDRAQAPRDR